LRIGSSWRCHHDQQVNGAYPRDLVRLVALATPLLAQNPAIDYIGYGWEDGGLLPSNPGDVLTITAVAVSVDPVFGVDLGVDELTFHMYDMLSTGEIPIGGGTVMISYVGGFLDIYRDPAQNADWGINPPNAFSPATFMDGALAFCGSFNNLTFFFNADGSGAFEGSLDGLSGEFIDDVCTGCAYTWGGSFTYDSGAQLPEGYDVQIDGLFELDGAVAEESSTWGDVKTLYGN